MTNPPKIAYRVEEAAQILGIHPSTVYELVRAGTLPHKRLGRRIIIPARALEEWLNTPEPWASYDYTHRK
ncbi:MAG: hypothetical protein KatS3mg073_0399 [Meiothermus sp.]|nr:MAG: hypothetical protein KatS3mg073_0399 [Meiothermus sp.]